jgi:hypothetical protein
MGKWCGVWKCNGKILVKIYEYSYTGWLISEELFFRMVIWLIIIVDCLLENCCEKAGQDGGREKYPLNSLHEWEELSNRRDCVMKKDDRKQQRNQGTQGLKTLRFALGTTSCCVCADNQDWRASTDPMNYATSTATSSTKGGQILDRVCKHWDQKNEQIDLSTTPIQGRNQCSHCYPPLSDAFGGHHKAWTLASNEDTSRGYV